MSKAIGAIAGALAGAIQTYMDVYIPEAEVHRIADKVHQDQRTEETQEEIVGKVIPFPKRKR